MEEGCAFLFWKGGRDILGMGWVGFGGCRGGLYKSRGIFHYLSSPANV